MHFSVQRNSNLYLPSQVETSMTTNSRLKKASEPSQAKGVKRFDLQIMTKPHGCLRTVDLVLTAQRGPRIADLT